MRSECASGVPRRATRRVTIVVVAVAAVAASYLGTPGTGRDVLPTASAQTNQGPVLSSTPPTITGPADVVYGPIASRRVAAYSAVAGDGAAVNNWSLPAGADRDKFSISSAGVLTFKAQPDRITAGDADGNFAYQVTVRSTDGSNRTAELPVTVRVNQPPKIDEGIFTLTVPENTASNIATY